VLEQVQRFLDQGQLIQSKNLFVYLGELMNIGLLNSFQYITLLFDLINEAENTQDQSHDFYLMIVVEVLSNLVLLKN